MKWKKSSKNFKNVNFNFLGTTKLYNQMHSYTHFLPTVRGYPNAATTSDVLLTGNSIDFSLSNIIIREKTKGILLQKTFFKKSHFDINMGGHKHRFSCLHSPTFFSCLSENAQTIVYKICRLTYLPIWQTFKFILHFV